MQEKKTHKTSVGGQALIEGIMILTGHIKTDAKGVPLKD